MGLENWIELKCIKTGAKLREIFYKIPIKKPCKKAGFNLLVQTHRYFELTG